MFIPVHPRAFAAVLTACLLGVIASSFAADIGIGDTRDEVLRRYGKPTSIATRGDREIFLYPKGGRIEFAANKVTDVKGPLPVVATKVPTAATPPQVAPATPPPTPAPNNALATDKAPKPAEPPPELSPTERLSREIENMEQAQSNLRAENHEPASINWWELMVSIVLHFGITIFALRVAFKYWEMDSFWAGLLAIAGIDLGIYAILEMLGPVTSGLTQMGALQSGIGTLVMVFTIQRFCFNKRLQNAVATALFVKVIVQLCHIFLFALLLNALFG